MEEPAKKYIMRAEITDPYDDESYYLVFSNLEQIAKDVDFLGAQDRINALEFESVNPYRLGEATSSILLEKLASISKCGENADRFVEITEDEIMMNLELVSAWTPAEIGYCAGEVRFTTFTDGGYRIYADLDANHIPGYGVSEFPIKEYRVSQSHCPRCGSSRIYGGDLDMDFIEAGQINQKIKCYDCGEEWEDVYTLTQVNYKGEHEETFNLKVL